MSGSSEEKRGAEAVDYVRTEQEAEAELKKREAERQAGGAPGSGDSPKPHGDKLANAVQNAAKEGQPDR